MQSQSLLSLVVKKIRKSVNIWQSYRQEYVSCFFDSRGKIHGAAVRAAVPFYCIPFYCLFHFICSVFLNKQNDDDDYDDISACWTGVDRL